MKKKLLLFFTLLMMLLSSTAFVSFAGQTAEHTQGNWLQDATGWWWQNNDRTYPVNSWEWIDGNGDGVAECYYFGPSGYLFQNTSTPDGYTVDANGAWIVNGSIQAKNISAPANTASSGNSSSSSTEKEQSVSASGGSGSSAGATQVSGGGSGLVWVSATGSKYHSIPNCGRMNPNKAHQETEAQALAHGLEKCSKCW